MSPPPQGEVVYGFGSAAKFRQSFINSISQSGGSSSAISLNNFDQTRFAKLFAFFIQAFRHTVGINHQNVPRPKFCPAFAVITKWSDADRETADVQTGDFAIGTHQQRRVVAGIDVRQLVRPRIKLAVKHGDVPVRRSIVVNVLIDFANDFSGR